MEKLTILIPHNKFPHLHDLMTEQCKNICKELNDKVDLQVVWVKFPADGMETFKSSDPSVIDSSLYKNALEILEHVKPDFVLMNGTLAFHNVETIKFCSVY